MWGESLGGGPRIVPSRRLGLPFLRLWSLAGAGSEVGSAGVLQVVVTSDLAIPEEVEGHGLVMIDYPGRAPVGTGTASIWTPVNFSGPMNLVKDAGWDAGAYVKLVP